MEDERLKFSWACPGHMVIAHIQNLPGCEFTTIRRQPWIRKQGSATAKDIEGKGPGNPRQVTDVSRNKLAGQGEQAQAKGEHAIEDEKTDLAWL